MDNKNKLHELKPLDFSKQYIDKLQASPQIKTNCQAHPLKMPPNPMVEQQKHTNTLVENLNDQVSELQINLENINSELKNKPMKT